MHDLNYRIVNDFFYLGGQMNVENLAGNQYYNFVFVAMTELPSVFIGEFLISRFGRRWMHVLCMAVTMVLYIIICIILEATDGTDTY